AHHAGLAPEGNREHSIGHQVSALNVGFMEHLLCIGLVRTAIDTQIQTVGYWPREAEMGCFAMMVTIS
ncbi:hypothetical protein, partial [Pseudomonas sp. NPDC089758]|uniref:hypothetical protein n=1 Tax=Pseudomonas sp. NPDC089758 TaxID=3364473 RepID=UPI003814A6DC